MSKVAEQARRSRAASRVLAIADRRKKDAALTAIAAELRRQSGKLVEANHRDVESARATDMAEAMLDRLTLTPERIEATAQGVEFVRGLPDPIGSRESMKCLENGLLVGRQRVPLGVIAMIYESRPNVTVDAAALCLKSGNSVLLRGGKEALHSNAALGQCIGAALKQVEMPEAAVEIIAPTDREGTRELLGLSELIDLAIPRGGPGLIRFVAENARVPVIKHYEGVCHLFLDAACDPAKAEAIALNSKAQRPGVCNALECLLVHRAVAESVLPQLGASLIGAGVEVRGCEATCRLVAGAKPADPSDFGQEFLAKVLAVRVVDDFEAALAHVAEYGSNHTEAICTESYESAQRWVREVDASCVVVNASTRFNDGGQLGLGAEIGISTSKLHAYGPMGLSELTTAKWVVLGQGQIRK